MMGTRPSAIATLVERTSRYTTLVALPDGIQGPPGPALSNPAAAEHPPNRCANP
ncbi:hypothetical protein ACIBI9_65490 [Nonomuraea sp. NPDC050451]|uniref:hypothetical protein n=1 Tax=Nonomuraea sp. NPDC050451 TaxID=3364364 RepID=UPI0037B45B01